jgi:hypothetical protein
MRPRLLPLTALLACSSPPLVEGTDAAGSSGSTDASSGGPAAPTTTAEGPTTGPGGSITDGATGTTGPDPSTSTGAPDPSTGPDPGTSAGPDPGTSTSSDETSSSGEDTGPPPDDLKLHQLQALGTHNSYHISPGFLVKEWDYTHKPLPEQLDNGVRKFEFDLHFGEPGEPIDVYHVSVLDTGTTCDELPKCLTALKGWSDEHPGHHLLYVMLEFKSGFDEGLAEDLFTDLENEILLVWPMDRVLVPDDIQGAEANLRDGVAANGWPTIDATRGKILFVLHDEGEWRDAYTDGGTSTAGRLLFPDAFGDLNAAFAAVHTINDPIADKATIEAVVDAGHLVRTRADADNKEPFDGDYTRADAAFASGAHFVSTDYPPPKGDVDYVVSVPGGAPSRCNPRTAPQDCAPAAIEDL